MHSAVIVLNFPFAQAGYGEAEIKSIRQWLRFFVELETPVVGTPPLANAPHVEQVIAELNTRHRTQVTVVPVPSFDTCERWRAGLQAAVTRTAFCGVDRFVLWASDFAPPDGSEDSRRAALDMVRYDGEDDLVVGTIDASGAKRMIDDCATYPLTNHWFPQEFAAMQHAELLRPRSELLNISRRLLEGSSENGPRPSGSLSERWYPSEQTIHLILQCLWSNGRWSVKARPLGKLVDMGSTPHRDIVQQVDRMELWLSYMWRSHTAGWSLRDYASLRAESFEIVQSAYRYIEAALATSSGST